MHEPPLTNLSLAAPLCCRVIGARDVLAIGDCSLRVGDRLPATAQASWRSQWCMHKAQLAQFEGARG